MAQLRDGVMPRGDSARGKLAGGRINLPKRGLRFTFSQVLQTEIGKPMVVEFRSVNQQTTGWPVRIAQGAPACLPCGRW